MLGLLTPALSSFKGGEGDTLVTRLIPEIVPAKGRFFDSLTPPERGAKWFWTKGNESNKVQLMGKIAPHPAVEEQG